MELLDGVKAMLELSESSDGETEHIMKNFRLVNGHWSSWATSATTMLRPSGNCIPLWELVEMAPRTFINLKSLHLDRVYLIADDDELRILCRLHNLKRLDLSSIENPFYTLTDVGVGYLASLTDFQCLNLTFHGTSITDVGMRHW